MNGGELLGSIALVTGAASGIGEAIAGRLGELGADIAVVDRDGDGARRVARELESAGRRGLAIEVDLVESGRIPGVVARVLEVFGRIDILVNCAADPGLRKPNTLLELSEEQWDTVHAVNVKAPFLLMQHVGRHMVERRGGGRIVNVVSNGAFRARAVPSYGSSKAALAQLGRTAAAELGPHGIAVNSVAPGMTRTPIAVATHGNEKLDAMVQGEGSRSNLLGRVAEPEEIASAVAYLCLPEARQITAQTIHVDGGQAL
jgi:NAD(P)-dependent dehydrogenase (short-subunit alcohol dehydrogenase family)